MRAPDEPKVLAAGFLSVVRRSVTVRPASAVSASSYSVAGCPVIVQRIGTEIVVSALLAADVAAGDCATALVLASAQMTADPTGRSMWPKLVGWCANVVVMREQHPLCYLPGHAQSAGCIAPSFDIKRPRSVGYKCLFI
jgi:hypothetical protein